MKSIMKITKLNLENKNLMQIEAIGFLLHLEVLVANTAESCY